MVSSRLILAAATSATICGIVLIFALMEKAVYYMSLGEWDIAILIVISSVAGMTIVLMFVGKRAKDMPFIG